MSINLLADAAGVLRSAKRRMPRAHLKAALAEHLPNRLAEALVTRMGLAKELGNIADVDLDKASETLTQLTFRPSGTEGFAKAEQLLGVSDLFDPADPWMCGCVVAVKVGA